MSDRPTPETDAAYQGLNFGLVVVSRKLERERDEARETLGRLRQDLADPPADVQEAVLDKLNLRSVITERNEARELVRELRDVMRLGIQAQKENDIWSINPSKFANFKELAELALTKAKEVLP